MVGLNLLILSLSLSFSPFFFSSSEYGGIESVSLKQFERFSLDWVMMSLLTLLVEMESDGECYIEKFGLAWSIR